MSPPRSAAPTPSWSFASKMRWSWLPFVLAACVEAPQIEGAAQDRLIEAAAPTLGFTCAEAGLELSWSVSAQPLVARYVVEIQGQGASTAIDLGFEGSGSQVLSTAMAAACAPCEARVVAYDGDGNPTDALVTESFDADEDGDGVATDTCGGTDCDDTDDTVYPGAAETCDGVDNDCNDVVDDLEGAPLAANQQGVCAGALKQCDGNGGWTEPDYTRIAGYEADEATCDGDDNDCDGQTDEALSAPLADNQNGVCAGAAKVCDGSGGWVEPDYTTVADFEAVEATCDGLNNDCDADTDEALSAPLADVQQGVCAGAEKVCDGGNGWIEPDYGTVADYEATEASCDGLDNDCDGGEDNGLTAPSATLDQGVCAGQVQWCDGTNGWQDPDYTQIATYEASEATCDGLDNDCNGVDDDLASAPLADLQDGVCEGARKVCDGSGGFVEPDYTAIENYAVVETGCDTLDNDCDAAVDEDAGTPPLADKQLGVCRNAVKVCDPVNGGWMEPDYSEHNALYGAEDCDGYDNDCDGEWDEFLPEELPLASNQDGVCAGSTLVCNLDQGIWVEPDLTELAGFEPTEASCDSLDNDCDGTDDNILEEDLSGTSTVECWGEYVRQRPELVDEGPWKAVYGDAQTHGDDMHGCALAMDDTLHCWGANNHGRLGDGLEDTLWERRWIAPVAGGLTFATVEMGNEAACGLTLTGELYCWGDWNSSGYPIPPQDSGVPVRVGNATWSKLDATGDHACVIDADGVLACFGVNSHGQLGFATEDSSYEAEPVVVLDTERWIDVGVMWLATCGLRDDNTLWCWGFSDSGRTGLDVPPSSGQRTPVPNQIAHPTGGTWTQLATGPDHGCALDSDGAAWCWGSRSYGKLGDGSDVGYAFQAVRAGTQTFARIESEEEGACGLTDAGDLYCWGEGRNTESNGLGVTADAWSPELVLSDVSDFGLGAYASYAVDSNGALWAWGEWDEPGTGPGMDRPTVRTSANVKRIASGYDHTCFIDDGDALWCMGANRYGQLGTGTITLDSGDFPQSASEPVMVMAGPVLDVDASLYYTCALDGDGHRWCWGRNSNGQVGNGTTQPVYEPWEDTSEVFTEIAIGHRHGCGIRVSDGRIACWGYNQAGPTVAVGTEPTPTVWTQLHAGDDFTCAVDDAGEAMCWGEGASRRLGTGSTTDLTYDQALANGGILESGPWADLGVAGNKGCGVKEDGTLWCWPWTGDYGVHQLFPERTWTEIEVSRDAYRFCALSEDGSPYCFGEASQRYWEFGPYTEFDKWSYYDEMQRIDGFGWTHLSLEYSATCGVRAALIPGTCE
ncbi:MAG: hypothetical protein EP330_13660 [Deltaproteobacteria bacterium]|nr:MAG: hypothetical protein EP330_13660 [Deltaproteobacteria bacterium]